MKKRGMLETQLKFIFVAIAGGLILLFFFSLVQKQKQVSEQELAERISRSIGNSLSVAQTTAEAEQTLQLPKKLRIRFDCEAATIKIAGVDRRISQYTIFAPEEVDDYTIITKVKPLQLPFTITNLLYITSPNIKYVIVYDTANENFAKELYEKLGNINKKMVREAEQLQDENDYEVKIILLTTTTNYYNNLPATIKKRNLKIVEVEKETTIPGKIVFYDSKLNKEGETEYTTDAMLLATIFSNSYKDYDCAMNKALEKMPSITTINTQKIITIMQNTARCRTNYQKHAILPLEELKKAAISKNIAGIKEYSEKIEQENNLLESLSCPTIY